MEGANLSKKKCKGVILSPFRLEWYKTCLALRLRVKQRNHTHVAIVRRRRDAVKVMVARSPISINESAWPYQHSVY